MRAGVLHGQRRAAGGAHAATGPAPRACGGTQAHTAERLGPIIFAGWMQCLTYAENLVNMQRRRNSRMWHAVKCLIPHSHQSGRVKVLFNEALDACSFCAFFNMNLHARRGCRY